MINLVVDSGNTATKVAIFNQHELLEKRSFMEEASLKEFLAAAEVDNCIISSVNIPANILQQWAIHPKQKFVLTSSLPLPITVQYATPQTLGVDRIAGVCGAWHLFPGSNNLVIDAGTCVTYDFIDEKGNYWGGGISPGMNMRFEALHTFTARLPLVKPANNPMLIGNSTETSIQSGIIYGLATEIDGIIGQYTEKYPQLKVILCGGDASFFENRLKASIFASPELVLIGLNSILNHNVNS